MAGMSGEFHIWEIISVGLETICSTDTTPDPSAPATSHARAPPSVCAGVHEQRVVVRVYLHPVNPLCQGLLSSCSSFLLLLWAEGETEESESTQSSDGNNEERRELTGSSPLETSKRSLMLPFMSDISLLSSPHTHACAHTHACTRTAYLESWCPRRN